MEMTARQAQELLARLRLRIEKITNMQDNIGLTPAATLAHGLNQELHGRARARDLLISGAVHAR